MCQFKKLKSSVQHIGRRTVQLGSPVEARFGSGLRVGRTRVQPGLLGKHRTGSSREWLPGPPCFSIMEQRSGMCTTQLHEHLALSHTCSEASFFFILSCRFD